MIAKRASRRSIYSKSRGDDIGEEAFMERITGNNAFNILFVLSFFGTIAAVMIHFG